MVVDILVCVCDYLLLKVLFAQDVQLEMVCDALDGAVGNVSLPAASLLRLAASLGLSSAGAGCVPSETVRTVKLREGERDKCPCRLCPIVFQCR